MTGNRKGQSLEEVENNFEMKLDDLFREFEENMVFTSRFLEWELHMVMGYKDFLKLFYHN